MIGVAGLARSGKDTLSKCLKKIIEREFKCDVEIIHLADKLKSDLDKLVSCNFNFQVFTENDAEGINKTYFSCLRRGNEKEMGQRYLGQKTK